MGFILVVCMRFDVLYFIRITQCVDVTRNVLVVMLVLLLSHVLDMTRKPISNVNVRKR